MTIDSTARPSVSLQQRSSVFDEIDAYIYSYYFYQTRRAWYFSQDFRTVRFSRVNFQCHVARRLQRFCFQVSHGGRVIRRDDCKSLRRIPFKIYSRFLIGFFFPSNWILLFFLSRWHIDILKRPAYSGFTKHDDVITITPLRYTYT